MANLERLLQTVGKRTFRNCYEKASRRGDSFSIEDLLMCDPALERYSDAGNRTKLSTLKRIIREGMGPQAYMRALNARR